MQIEDHIRRMPWSLGETPHDHAALFPPEGEDPKQKAAKLKAMRGNRGDKLVGEAAKIKGSLMKWVREDEANSAWAIIHAFIISLVCISVFIVMLLMWFEVYHWSFGWSVLIFLACLAASIGMAVFGAQNRLNRTWIIVMGCMCAAVTFLGLVFGFFMYFRYLVYYQRYLEMRTYSNVGGSQGTSEFDDGSMFLFTQDTRLDVMRSVGYKSRFTGEVYCVAPVVDSTMTAADHINFWAVGSDCCLARGVFECDDAQDSKAMSALVVLEPEDVVRPFMRWAVAGSVYPRYERSIKLQEAAYATRQARRIKMLHWVKDPIAKQDSYYKTPRNIAIWFTVCLWIFLLFLSFGICYKCRAVRQRHDKRLQGTSTPLNAQEQTPVAG